MSKYYTERDWLDKKISDGYFGFGVVKLNELYSEDVLQDIKTFFDTESSEISKISDTLVNSRDSNPKFQSWFKKELEENNGKVSEKISKTHKKLYSNGLVRDKNGRVRYDYKYISKVFEYLHNTEWTLEEINNIPLFQDVCLTVEPSSLTNNIDEYKKVIKDKTNIFNSIINQISTDAIRYLYDEDLNDYDEQKQHINIIPEYGVMGMHYDDTSGDDRDFTTIIYLSTEYRKEYEGLLKFYYSPFGLSAPSQISSDPKSVFKESKYGTMGEYSIEPSYLNVVVMNHEINDNVAGLIRHEVTKHLSAENRYSVYTTYIRKK